MSCVFACVLNWSSYSSSHSRCRRFMFKNPALTLPNWGQEGSFLLHKERVLYSCVFSPDCLHVKQWQRRRRRSTARPCCVNVSEKHCVQRARDCKCVFELFSPASRQRSEPGQELIAATVFFSPSTHLDIHPSCSDVAELLRYSVCPNKQELGNKRLPTCYGCPLNYGQAKKRKNINPIKCRHWSPLCLGVCACVFFHMPQSVHQNTNLSVKQGHFWELRTFWPVLPALLGFKAQVRIGLNVPYKDRSSNVCVCV